MNQAGKTKKSKWTKWIILLLLIGSVLLYFLITKTGLPNISLTQENTAQEAPELKDILDSSDQKKQFTAARKLTERVGVEEALDILYKSSLPKTGEGHLVVHQIGYYAYKKYGIDAILHCKDYFLFACYHGAIIEAASDQGFKIIPKMTDRCKTSTSRYFQCIHAAGHALVAMWDYNLPKALEMCDEFYEKDTDVPGAVSSCHNGAFMENIFGVHDWGTGNEQKRDWLSTDRYFPCNHFDEKYQEGCWLNQASRIFQLDNGDIATTTKDCDAIGNQQYTTWCIDSLARQVHGLTYGDPQATFGLCEQMGTNWYNTCVLVNAGAFYSVSGRDEAIFVCAQAEPNLKKDCYEGIISLISLDSIEKPEKERLCNRMESPFNEECLTQIDAAEDKLQ